ALRATRHDSELHPGGLGGGGLGQATPRRGSRGGTVVHPADAAELVRPVARRAARLWPRVFRDTARLGSSPPSSAIVPSEGRCLRIDRRASEQAWRRVRGG